MLKDTSLPILCSDSAVLYEDELRPGGPPYSLARSAPRTGPVEQDSNSFSLRTLCLFFISQLFFFQSFDVHDIIFLFFLFHKIRSQLESVSLIDELIHQRVLSLVF